MFLVRYRWLSGFTGAKDRKQEFPFLPEQQFGYTVWPIDTFQNHAHFLDAILNEATNIFKKKKKAGLGS